MKDRASLAPACNMQCGQTKDRQILGRLLIDWYPSAAELTEEAKGLQNGRNSSKVSNYIFRAARGSPDIPFVICSSAGHRFID